MLSQLKMYLYSFFGLLIAGLLAAFKYKAMKLESAQKKLEKAKADIKAKNFELKMKETKGTVQKPPDVDITPGDYSLALLPLLFTLVGCVSTQTTCPRLEKAAPVEKINFTVDKNYCVCGDNLYHLVDGVISLRQSNLFYEMEIDEYNKEFAHAKLERDSNSL